MNLWQARYAELEDDAIARSEARHVVDDDARFSDLATRPPDALYDEFDRFVVCVFGDAHRDGPCGDCVASAIDELESVRPGPECSCGGHDACSVCRANDDDDYDTERNPMNLNDLPFATDFTVNLPDDDAPEQSTRLRFERPFSDVPDRWYPVLDGRVIGKNSIGAESKEAAEREYFANYAWPGGYPVVYVLDGDTICGDCALRIYRGEYSDHPDSVVDCASLAEESTSDVICDNCNRLIAAMNWCEECSSDDYLVTKTVEPNSAFPDGIEATYCAKCAGEVDDIPRYYVIAGSGGGYMPFHHSHEDVDGPDAAGYVIEVAREVAAELAHELAGQEDGADDFPITQESADFYVIDDGSLGLYVEVVPAE